MEKITKGYKGFTKDWKCNDMQYTVGEIAELEPGKKLTVCPNDIKTQGGLHFCLNPFHVLRYYSASKGSKYAEVEGIGEALTHSEDSKVAVSKIKVSLEIGLKGLIRAGLQMVFDRVKKIKPHRATLPPVPHQATLPPLRLQEKILSHWHGAETQRHLELKGVGLYLMNGRVLAINGCVTV